MNKTATILGAMALPALSVLLHRGVQAVLRWRELKDERFLKKLMDSKRKMVKELKVRGWSLALPLARAASLAVPGQWTLAP